MSKTGRSIKPVRQRRPAGITLMFFVFLLWTVLGWLRLMRVVTGRSLILSILPPGFYWYLFFSGLVWGVIGLPILWGLLRGAAWMYKIFYFAALFYPLHYWFERLFLWQDPNAQKNWPFMFVLTFLWLSFAFWVRRSARVRRFFIQNQSEGP